MQDNFYTVKQIAELFDVRTRTVTRWIRQGKLPNAFKIGSGRTSAFVVPVGDVVELQKERGATNPD